MVYTVLIIVLAMTLIVLYFVLLAKYKHRYRHLLGFKDISLSRLVIAYLVGGLIGGAVYIILMLLYPELFSASFILGIIAMLASKDILVKAFKKH